MYAFFSGDPQLFQSSGALGIAAAILLYGHQQNRLADLIGTANTQELVLFRERTSLKLREIEARTKLNSLILREGNLQHDGPSNNPDDMIEQVKAQLADLDLKLADLDAGIASHKELATELSTRSQETLKSLIRTEVSVVALATVRTGFGEKIMRTLIGG